MTKIFFQIWYSPLLSTSQQTVLSVELPQISDLIDAISFSFSMASLVVLRTSNFFLVYGHSSTFIHVWFLLQLPIKMDQKFALKIFTFQSRLSKCIVSYQYDTTQHICLVKDMTQHKKTQKKSPSKIVQKHFSKFF